MAKQDMTNEATAMINDLVSRVNTSSAKRVSSVRTADQCGIGIAGIIFVSSFCVMSPDAPREHLGSITVYPNGKTSGMVA